MEGWGGSERSGWKGVANGSPASSITYEMTLAETSAPTHVGRQHTTTHTDTNPHQQNAGQVVAGVVYYFCCGCQSFLLFAFSAAFDCWTELLLLLLPSFCLAVFGARRSCSCSCYCSVCGFGPAAHSSAKVMKLSVDMSVWSWIGRFGIGETSTKVLLCVYVCAAKIDVDWWRCTENKY